MAFEIPKQPYTGRITEVTIGSGPHAITVGGQDSYPFHLFEGNMPNPPKIAMEVWDYDPSEDWPEAAIEPFKDVLSSPEAWAKKCVEEYGADLVVLQLKSTDPNGMDRSAEEAAEVAKKVLEAVDVPLVLWGTANNQKDEEVLKKIAELCEGKNVALAPVEEGNHKGVGASALGYGQTIVASTPIDVNLAKQLNILLGNLGVPMNKILIDPTIGGLGYGLEYSYSVMERIRMAALTQEDDKLQLPIIANIGNEVWKCKEAGEDLSEAPTMGDPERRAIHMETVSAVCYLMSGADILILRHPESVRLARSFIDLMLKGGVATEIQGISKSLELQEADLLSLSPEPNLDFGKAETAPKAKPAKERKTAAPKAEKKEAVTTPAPKIEKKVVELKPKAEKEAKEVKKAAKAETKAQVQAKTVAEQEAQARAEAEAKARAEEQAKAEEEAKARAREAARKAEAEAKAKAEEEARQREEDEKRQQQELKALREKRARERQKMSAAKTAKGEEKEAAADAEKTLVDRLIERLDLIHRRV